VRATKRPRVGPEDVVTGSRPVYRMGRALLHTYLGLLHRLRVEGREHLPRAGGVLIVANHQSFLDIPVLASGAPRHVAFVARASLAHSRFLAFIMRESGCVLIHPNTPDRAALEGMIAHLEGGDCVAVFPEGTRTPDGALGAFRGGAAVAARRAGVPIVPAAITGAFEAWPRHRRLPRPGAVHVRFGAPLTAEGREPMERAREAIREMMGERSAASG
jgi:1-acyl-sn-glycerol-3-phosphate acyltransferase